MDGAEIVAGILEADDVRECTEVSAAVVGVVALRVLVEALAFGWVGGGDFD